MQFSSALIALFSCAFLTPSVLADCPVSADIKCTVDKNGLDCAELLRDRSNCFEPVTYVYEYCNYQESDDVTLLENAELIVYTTSVDFATSTIPAGQCIEQTYETEVDTCQGSFHSSLKVAGKNSDDDYCYAYKFLKTEPRPPCKVSADVECTVVEDGSDCADIETTPETCGDIDVKYDYEFCNLNFEKVNLNAQTFYKIDDTKTSIDLSPMDVDECRGFERTVTVDTCKYQFATALKVEGTLDVEAYNYCYGYKYLKSIPSKNVYDPAPCMVTADVTCTVPGADNMECASVVSNPESCNVEVEFTYTLCNNNDGEVLISDRTKAKSKNVIIGFEYSDSIASGMCEDYVERIVINTCYSDFRASIAFNGSYEGETCYAYKFYSESPLEMDTPATSSPSYSPSAPSPSKGMKTKSPVTPKTKGI